MQRQLLLPPPINVFNSESAFFSSTRSKEDVKEEFSQINSQLLSSQTQHKKLIDLLIYFRDRMNPELRYQLDFKKIDNIDWENRKETIYIACGFLIGVPIVFTALGSAFFSAMGHSWLTPSVGEGAKVGAQFGAELGLMVGITSSSLIIVVSCCCQKVRCCCGAKSHTQYLEQIRKEFQNLITSFQQATTPLEKKEIIENLNRLIKEPLMFVERRICELTLRERQLDQQLKLIKFQEKKRIDPHIEELKTIAL